MRYAIVCTTFIALAASVALGQSESPITVNLCELKKNPDAYNHKLIQVQGTVSHEFEDFSLNDPACPQSNNSPWLTYGGDVSDDVAYCCNGTGNKSSVQVEGIDIPIQKDEVLERFKKLTNSYRIDPKAKVHYAETNPTFSVNATLKGRFFAGQPNPKFLINQGFGHLGCCPLLAIQQIVSIDNVVANLKPGEKSCYTEGWHLTASDQQVIAAHNELKKSGEKWRYDDAQRVAADALSDYLKTSIPGLVPLGCRSQHLTYGDKKDDQYAVRCFWNLKPSDSYASEVMKFSELKSPATKWKDILWMPFEITHQHCSTSASIE